MACSHLLMKAGACPCGYRVTDIAIAPAIIDHVTFSASEPLPAIEPEIPITTDWDVAGAIAERCRQSLARYVREAWEHLPHLKGTRLTWNWHHEALCEHLQVMAEEWAAAKSAEEGARVEQRIKNLLINIAPGTTKTLITLVFFPTWMWTRWPNWSCRCVSSNPRAILESSDYARTLVESPWYQRSFVPETGDEDWAEHWELEPWRVRDDLDAKSDWGNTLGGFRRSTGLKAPITGEHTDFLLCDDPHDAEQVRSEAERENVISKWDNALFNRVNDARIACRVVVMQRLHVLDLAAHILEVQAALWAHLVIASKFEPAYSKTTPIGWCDPRRELGELLDPVRFPEDVLAAEKIRLGEAGFNAQHQQRPDAVGGQMFPATWWRFFSVEGDPPYDAEKDHRPKDCRKDPPVMCLKRDRWGSLDVDAVCVSVDATFGSTSDTASAVGIIVGANKAAARMILDDLTEGPRTFLQTVDDVKGAVKHAANITGKRQVRVIIEKKANGAACLEMMEKALREGEFVAGDGRPIQVVFEAYEPGQNSKDSRAHAGTVDVEGGVVLLRDQAKWLRSFIGEHASFGGGGRNDRVDATAQYLDRYRKKVTWGDALRALRARTDKPKP